MIMVVRIYSYTLKEIQIGVFQKKILNRLLLLKLILIQIQKYQITQLKKCLKLNKIKNSFNKNEFFKIF